MKSIAAEPDLLARLQLIRSVDGVGERTALSLLLLLPELGYLEREPIVSLAGLAPFVSKSGKWTGHSRIDAGRDRVRRALDAASLAAAFRWNPAIKELYQRLKAAGKSHGKSWSPAPARCSSRSTPSSCAALPGSQPAALQHDSSFLVVARTIVLIIQSSIARLLAEL